MWGRITNTLIKSNFLKFCQKLEQKLQEEIEDSFPDKWNEDYISLRLVSTLGKMRYHQIKFFNSYNNILILPYKQTGKVETKFGDIAIVLDIEFRDGDKIKGVAFLEAKRYYKEHNDYHKLDFDQLKRINSNAPHSKLLLYDFNHVTKLAPTGLDSSRGTGGMLPKIPATYISNINSNTAIKHNKKDSSLHKLAIPFSYQFTYRYLNGMDLEFDEDKIKSALGYYNEKYGTPKFLVMVTIKPGKSNQKEIEGVFQPDVNREIFTPIRIAEDDQNK